MGRQLDRIPVPEKLDEVIGESLRQLRREKRKKRMTAAAGLAAAGVGIFLCIYMTGILRAYRLLMRQETE